MQVQDDKICHAELVSASHQKGCEHTRGVLKQVQDDMQVQDDKICHAELVSASQLQGLLSLPEGS